MSDTSSRHLLTFLKNPWSIAAITAVCIILAYVLPLAVLDFAFDSAAFTDMLATLAFLIVMVERAVELTLFDHKAAEKNEAKRIIEVLNKQIEASLKQEKSGNAPGKGQSDSDLKALKGERLEKQKTLDDIVAERTKEARRLAFIYGLVLSVFGFRFVLPLLAIADEGYVAMDIIPFQRYALIFVDLILSAIILGGGSDSFHRLSKRILGDRSPSS